MEWFIPVETFRKKLKTFRGITFFPLWPKRPKFFATFVWIASARHPFERKHRALSIQPKRSVWVFGNFQERIKEQNFQKQGNLARYTQFFENLFPEVFFP